MNVVIVYAKEGSTKEQREELRKDVQRQLGSGVEHIKVVVLDGECSVQVQFLN